MGKIKSFLIRVIIVLKSIVGKSPIDDRDIFVFGGIALIGYGVYLIYPPYSYLSVGILLLLIGLFYGKPIKK